MIIDGKEFNPGYIPVGKNLLVFPIPTEEVTKGGIVIPTQIKEREDMKNVEAVVISIAPGAWADQTEIRNGQRLPAKNWCKEGDTIVMSAYAGIHRSGQDGLLYRVIRDLDIVAVKESK